MDMPSIKFTLQVMSVACASFLLGILFISENMMIPQGDYLVFGIGIGTGVLLPLLLPLFQGINKAIIRWVFLIYSAAAAMATIMLINGIFLPFAATVLCMSLPCLIVFGFTMAMLREVTAARWRRDVVCMILASSFSMLGRSIKIAPFTTWYALYAVVAVLVTNAIVHLIPGFPRVVEQQTREIEVTRSSRVPSMSGGAYFALGIVLGAIAGAISFVPGFLGDLAWIDPNPMSPGVPRTIIERPWAPWDTIAIIAGSIVIDASIIKALLDRPKWALHVSSIMFAGFLITWLASWSSITIPLFIWSLSGITLFFGAIGSLIIAILRWFVPPFPGSRVGEASRRAWCLVVPFIGSSAAGLMLRGIFDRAMTYLPVMIIIPVLSGVIIFTIWFTLIMQQHYLSPPERAFTIERKHGRHRVDAVLVAFLALGATYAAGYAMYHAPYHGTMERLYMWGGVIGSWTPEVEARVTHATVFSLGLNLTSGEVSSTWLPADNTPYHNRGIEVMPTIFLAYSDLYYMLKNTGGKLDKFITSLRSTLIATQVDGVSIDFEMLTTPAGAPRVTTEDWISTWERISAEACHGGGNDFLLGVYWQIYGEYSRDQVNRYFRAVDIHVENMYEHHQQTSYQGSTIVIEASIENIIDVYALLDDTAMMAKIMPGLPVYHYIWIDGQRVSLNESLILPGGSWWPFHAFSTLEQVMIDNNATFRWDPFSGATWARFEMTLQDNRTVTVVAYLHDTAHLARTMHVMEGYGINGIMLWPAHQMVPPGFIQTFFHEP
nr:glycosyl hydrolase family 18 protein [Candidatus Sigynarchaeota archaeon]